MHRGISSNGLKFDLQLHIWGSLQWLPSSDIALLHYFPHSDFNNNNCYTNSKSDRYLQIHES